MTGSKDKDGNYLPDDQRLTHYGKALRFTSLDELPELFNILKGDMSIVGPRPMLVRDMVFMTEKQRHRHDVRPGLSGLAQVNGRNAINWFARFEYDLEYVKHITLIGDIKIVFKTIRKIFAREGISEDGMETSMDYGRKNHRTLQRKYIGFHFGHFLEKLNEVEKISITYGALYRILTEAKFKSPKGQHPQKNSSVHPMRPIKENFGEMLQIDASLHN